jgi:hypothetical protein
MTESASAMSSRASGLDAIVTFSITTMESATRPMPASIVMPMPTTVSMVRSTPSFSTIRRSAIGITTALTEKAIAAVR